eukprot:529419_1
MKSIIALLFCLLSISYAKEDEDDSKLSEINESSVYVDVIEEEIKPSSAFQIFGGNLYDPSSSSSRRNKKLTASRVYDSSNTTKNRNFESPLQTYKRLEFEIQEFNQKLSKIAEKANKDQQDPTKQITQQLSQELAKLWSNVEAFKNDPQIASLFAEANSALLDTVDANYLFKRLQDFQASQLNDDKKQQNNDDDDGGNRAVFTLYHDGTMNNESYRMNELQSRLSNLEKIIGRSPDNASIGDMTRSIEYLSSILSLLSDDMKLEGLVRRAQVLRKKLQEIQAKGHAAIELQITKTKEEKINKLFDMMTRWDQAALQLPTIVQRLRSIKNLHEESANVIEKVNKLEVQNKLIQQSLTSNKSILNNVQKSLAENASVMSKNMKLIQERLDKVSETMKKLNV